MRPDPVLAALRKALRECLDRLGSPAAGPIALVFCESGFLAAATCDWVARLGVSTVIAVGETEKQLTREDVIFAHVAARLPGRAGAALALAEVSRWATGRWMLHCFNGEFPVFPWCETRTLADLAAFQEGERRFGVGGWTVDLHISGMADAAESADPDWPRPDHPLLELGGCFALTGPPRRWEPGPPAQTETRLYGGLGWRFQDRLGCGPPRLDRTPFFKARRGLAPDGWLHAGDPAADGLSGPWHRSPTMAVASFRAAAALLAHPQVALDPPELPWAGSRPWDWSSEALLDMGVIEPGQWF